MQMMQQFAQFRRMMQGRNPQQMVQNLLQSGQMFLAACSGAEIAEILRVVNEHMEAVRVIYPKEYEAITKKIFDTKEKR